MKIKYSLIILLTSTTAFAGDLPNHQLTPGLADPRLTKDILCAKDFTTTAVRDVSEALKNQVYKSYHMSPSKTPCPCEIDHLISLELGGSNSAKNLWPQSYITKPWNAHIKDKLENELHRQVCMGKITLSAAQNKIATNWITLYKQEFVARRLEIE